MQAGQIFDRRVHEEKAPDELQKVARRFFGHEGDVHEENGDPNRSKKLDHWSWDFGGFNHPHVVTDEMIRRPSKLADHGWLEVVSLDDSARSETFMQQL